MSRARSSRSTTTFTDPARLQAGLTDPDLRVLDARPLAAYNGWRLRGEARGGHIPGAGALPSEWLARLGDADLQALADQHGLDHASATVVYGYDEAEAEALAKRLAGIGATRLRILDGGWAGWASDTARPVELLPGYRQLVHPRWLRDVLEGATPEAPPTGRLLLFHVNFGVPEEYAESHLPGAAYLDTNWLEDPADWNRRPPADLGRALAGLGISHDATVVLYGRDTEGDAHEKWPGRRAGQIAATRAALILRYAGVDDVRLLDGGFDRWVHEGHALETEPRAYPAVSAFGVPIPQRPELIVDIGEAKEILADRDGAALVSVRTWREHIGAVSGYNYIGPAGRIAGDVWGNCGTDAYHMQHYRAVDNAMRPYPEIAANWASAGITPDKWVAFYCGTGWRASETWFYAWIQGWPRIAVYDGGWFEWSADPVNNPIEVGLPAGEPDGVAAA
ncbi:MAG TPA: rhodanese-like domain-containing protein [Candidatus Limnocylindrales bacterium]|nr:rhodanese-like domain-containing protein [Candidatus Limnocylindrales bacterium]